MGLLTPSIQFSLPKIYTTDEVPLEEKIVICKFFTPWAFWSWFVFEGEMEGKIFFTDSRDFVFYGMAHGFEKEIGYFKLSDLESIRGPCGLIVERDLSVFKTRYIDCCTMPHEKAC
jgi:DUF2958 family protein